MQSLNDCCDREQTVKNITGRFPEPQELTQLAMAVDAVLRDIDRIIRGGTTNPALSCELLDAAEAARQRCVGELYPGNYTDIAHSTDGGQ